MRQVYKYTTVLQKNLHGNTHKVFAALIA